MSLQPHGSRRPYRPLPDPKTWIRLMKVTRNQSGTICCTLHAFNVSELAPESFLALSYEWGPPRDLVEIQVDGCPLQIRPTLAAFLTRMTDTHGHATSSGFGRRGGALSTEPRRIQSCP